MKRNCAPSKISAALTSRSNDYLGLATDPRLKQAVVAAVANAKAVGSTGSRLLSGNTPEWEELESEFADFAQTDAALYFGSGYSANVGLLSSILRPGDVVFSDAFNHASLIDGIRLSRATKVIYPHADMHFLERALREHSQGAGAKVIITESVFSMEGDIAPISSLLRLARDHGAELILDEAHATGVLGPRGRGLAAERGVTRETLAIVHTCGKALASAGAFVCCGATLKNYLVNRARTFIFSTAMPPYFAGQIRAALDLAMRSDAERAHLREIGNLLREELSAMGLGFGGERHSDRSRFLWQQRICAARRGAPASERLRSQGHSPPDSSRRHGAGPHIPDGEDHARRRSAPRASVACRLPVIAAIAIRKRCACLAFL